MRAARYAFSFIYSRHILTFLQGVLNLVDLAGSERLDKAGTAEHKDRMKETININKSLSSLQNVIQKLSEKSTDGKTHVNYRDSQLTYLLQNSLSGGS